MRAAILILILPLAAAQLETIGNHIYKDGEIFYAQGFNIHDQRSCNRCAGWNGLDEQTRLDRVNEVKRRIDKAVEWNATIIRLLMESTPASPDHGDVTEDSQYLAEIVDITNYAVDQGLVVLLSSWVDHTEGLPDDHTVDIFTVLEEHIDSPYVMFGLVNEPQLLSFEEYYNAYNQTIFQLRNITGRILTVGGREWARDISYYKGHPLGENIVYETHQYNGKEEFQSYFIDASESLPVLIGEFGPCDWMDEDDIRELVTVARQRQIPIIAWTFHQACPPNLIEVESGDQCGGNNPMPLIPSDWGRLVLELFNPDDIFSTVYKWKNGQITIEELMLRIIEWKSLGLYAA